jgi:hypothetical protein
LVAAVLVIASPFFYLLQRQIDIQVYLLLLGVQILTLHAFSQRPTVQRATAAIGINILLSMTSYTALLALSAAVVYLLIVASRSNDVSVARWRALLWLAVPFSFSGYLLWAVFWVVDGSRLATSHFVPTESVQPAHLAQVLADFGNDLALPLLLLFALGLACLAFLQRPAAQKADGWNRPLGWAVFTFIAVTIGSLGLQKTLQRLPIQPEVITFSMVLLIPAALGTMYGHARQAFRRTNLAMRLGMLVTAVTLLVLFPLEYVVRPAAFGENPLPSEPRVAAQREAAAAFTTVDPGGRILVDPRYAATFILAAGIDPNRLITPFDSDFPQLASNPPDDVGSLVVTDSLDDFVGGNYPALRTLNLELVPEGQRIAEGKVESDKGTAAVRVYRLEHFGEPDKDVPAREVDPTITQWEDTVLTAMLEEMDKRQGLPLRPDGWAYAVDVGNIMVYAARRGDIKLFNSLSDLVKKHYVVMESDDSHALYTVAWRARLDRPAEASGTTETLRMVEAYWLAGERWNNEYYRRLAYVMSKAYAEHQWSDEYGEGWYIQTPSLWTTLPTSCCG